MKIIILTTYNLTLKTGIMAMRQEKYSFTWQTYSDHLRSMMKELMMNEDFTDVTLVTEDKKQIKAHTSILSACSSVFKDILMKDNNSSNQIIYLRGIHSAEVESILQFIYIGEATCIVERMDELLSVKSLEVKELCNTEATKGVQDDKPTSPWNSITTTLKSEEEIAQSAYVMNRALKVMGKYECEECQKGYTSSGALLAHKQGVHQGIKFHCDQCQQQFTQQTTLNRHIQNKHEGVRYACNQCRYQAASQSSLKVHFRNKHEGIKYACDQCDYKASQKNNLKSHKANKHQKNGNAMFKFSYWK